MTKSISEYTFKELMLLPHRVWDKISEYDSILIISTRRKHDSGWAAMAIIGVNKQIPVEIACCCCDDIEWKLPPMVVGGNGQWTQGQFRMDCAFKSGALHAWNRGVKFRVGESLSSVEIEMIRLEPPCPT